MCRTAHCTVFSLKKRLTFSRRLADSFSLTININRIHHSPPDSPLIPRCANVRRIARVSSACIYCAGIPRTYRPCQRFPLNLTRPRASAAVDDSCLHPPRWLSSLLMMSAVRSDRRDAARSCADDSHSFWSALWMLSSPRWLTFPHLAAMRTYIVIVADYVNNTVRWWWWHSRKPETDKKQRKREKWKLQSFSQLISCDHNFHNFFSRIFFSFTFKENSPHFHFWQQARVSEGKKFKVTLDMRRTLALGMRQTHQQSAGLVEVNVGHETFNSTRFARVDFVFLHRRRYLQEYEEMRREKLIFNFNMLSIATAFITHNFGLHIRASSSSSSPIKRWKNRSEMQKMLPLSWCSHGAWLLTSYLAQLSGGQR